MTKVRAEVVCEESLYEVAKSHNFSDFILIGKSEENSGGRFKPAILADSIEATIAAIYFDGGLDEAEEFIITNLKDAIAKSTKHVGMKDHKTVLQEKLQENGDISIKYTVIKETGPDHDKTFTVKVEADGKELAIGEGRTKKQRKWMPQGRLFKILNNLYYPKGGTLMKKNTLYLFLYHI